MKLLRVLLALITLVAVPLDAKDRVAVSVSPRFAFAPATVVVRTTVVRDPDNRAMEVTVDGQEYYRSSFVQLDGDSAPRTTTLELRDLPGGSYLVKATLLDRSGSAREIATQEIEIYGR